MSWINTERKFAWLLAFTVLGSVACNNQKAELVQEEDATESPDDAAPHRDNRNNESGDAAFIKIFPDGEVSPTQGESASVNVPTPSVTTSPAPSEVASPAPANEIPEGASTTSNSDAAAPAQSPQETATQTTAAEETPSLPPSGSHENEEAPASPLTPAENSSQTPAAPGDPTAAPANVTEPAPAVTQVTPAAAETDEFDYSRPVLTLNEASASQIITVQPKENKAILTIGKHSDFSPGPYMIMAKWSSDSKKVKVNVSEGNKDKDCSIDEVATQGEWKTLGVFYLTKKAKVVITNGKNKSHAVKNELLLKPVVAKNLNKPSKFKCLGGQIKGQGLVEFQ